MRRQRLDLARSKHGTVSEYTVRVVVFDHFDETGDCKHARVYYATTFTAASLLRLKLSMSNSPATEFWIRDPAWQVSRRGRNTGIFHGLRRKPPYN